MFVSPFLVCVVLLSFDGLTISPHNYIVNMFLKKYFFLLYAKKKRIGPEDPAARQI